MESYWSDSFYRPPRPRRAVDHDFAPPPPQGAELDRFSGRWSHADPNPEGSNHDGQVIYAGPPPGPARPKSPRARRRRGSTELVYIDEYVRHGSHRHAYGDREFQMTAEEEHQTTCDPDQPVNVHVQLQLPIALDLDDELGELARLRRVGDFRAAKSFFRSKLAEHIGNPYVFVQYAELLLAMEDYKALKSLRPPPSFGVSIEEEGLRRARREKGLNTEDGADPWLDLHPRAEGTLLFWNWSLIKSLVLIHADDCVYSVEWLRSTFSYLDFQDDLGSTEVQIIVLSIKLFVAAFKSASQLNHIGSLQSDFEHWVDWGSLFASLSRQNRHWDCCDLKAIDAIAFGYREHWNWQNNLPGRDRFDFDFTGPWEQLDHDEASLLACLDQTTSVTLAHFTAKPYVIDYIKKSANMLSMMNSAAELLKRHYPAAMRSRPFVRWLILSSQAARAAVAQEEDDNNFSTDRQYPRRIPSPDDSADQRWDDAAAKDRQVILWKGDFRNHEQWLALNRGELDPEEYYRRWAARNPDAARAAWSSRPSLERERERRDAESDSCDSGDESSPVARVARRRWDSHSSSSDGEGSSWYPEHQYYPPPPITSEVVDRRDAPGIPPASKAPDSPTFTQGQNTAEPAEMVTSKEPTWTWRQPTVISTAPAEVQRPSVPPDESATRSRRARVDDDSDSDAPPLTRGSQDYHPHEPRINSAPTSLHGNVGRYSSHRELDTTPGAADPVRERRYASPRGVRWEDHERRRQNDRIGNRAPSVVTSDGPSHALSAEASAPLTPVVRKQQRMEPGRRRPSVAVVPLPTEGMPRTAPRRGRPSVTIADPAVGSSTAVDAAGLAHAQAFEGGSLSSNRITLPNSRAHYDIDKKWWYCNCNPDLAASIRRVNKETKNKGRRFWTCSKDRSMSCDFFLWEDDACVVEARAEGQSPP
ncbi:hypothetical protein MGG_08489 [Pyricularia oryzae 70-15]|uniref:GRF-type domain-containing protein n=1 Tax=Pyricularia oryzae (strain 70-15 / ATCC MYA-4617 / FGSC 8958) TaxID=242507 RepID=G4NAN5_PYRO7|nr:uncharacterized protein MGG_08489 [Pyricularia oryzae 70-15]EHA49678.1 hypothetical protein MGG_08489 [Pyricularia oryzae 70-15]